MGFRLFVDPRNKSGLDIAEMQRPTEMDDGMTYKKFAAMIATSTAIMFGLMYLNSYAVSHIWFSQTRMWMAALMGAVMALIMIAFMWGMYRNRRANWAIVGVSMIAAVGALWLVRSQQTVDDVSWMKAMIPHHSIAILTSERAHIRDPEVRKLADGIIEAQEREIAEMKNMIARLETNPLPAGAPDLAPASLAAEASSAR